MAKEGLKAKGGRTAGKLGTGKNPIHQVSDRGKPSAKFKSSKYDYVFHSLKEAKDAIDAGKVKPHSTIKIDENIIYITGDLPEKKVDACE